MIRFVDNIAEVVAELLDTPVGSGGLGFDAETIKTERFPGDDGAARMVMVRREGTAGLKKDSPIDPAIIEIQTQDEDPAQAYTLAAKIADAIDGLVEKDFLSGPPHTIMSTEHQTGPIQDKNEDLELSRYIIRFIMRVRVAQP